jgi:hypothetical protein
MFSFFLLVVKYSICIKTAQVPSLVGCADSGARSRVRAQNKTKINTGYYFGCASCPLSTLVSFLAGRMSAQNAEPSLKPPPPRMSGVKTVLRYTGIPPSWLDKRPKLPSRNWLIFLSVTSTIVGYGVYDRRECRRIRQEYIEKVQHLAEEPLHPLDLPRQVVVYGSKWPGDEEYQQAMKYFRKYVKVWRCTYVFKNLVYLIVVSCAACICGCCGRL